MIQRSGIGGYGERQHIGSEVRRMRQERGWTLEDLAEQGGFSASHLSRMERGLTLPSFSLLSGIARALEVSLDHFVELEAEVGQLNRDLRDQLGAAGVSPAQVEEILTLSVPSRRALHRALNR